MASLYTVGYEKMSQEEFLVAMERQKIKLVIDVQEYPSSRIEDFNKSDLSLMLPANGIRYRHLPMLGSPKTIRDDFHTDWNYPLSSERYVHYLETDVDKDILTKVASVAARMPCCLHCLEHDPTKCHRSKLAGYLLDQYDEIDSIQDISDTSLQLSFGW
ncbi:MAG: DUF488 family protein [Flexilinea sp.]